VKSRFSINIVVLLVMFFFIGSCLPTRKNRMLTFFFDGVPPLDTLKNDTLDTASRDTISKLAILPLAVVSPEITVHDPYRKNDCYSCHNEKTKVELVLPQPDVCYVCHVDYAKKYKYVHGPVAGGYCTQCHNAHMSKTRKLLIRTGQELCLYCHDSGSVFKSEVHKEKPESECTFCHNPHGGNDRSILN
jgi:predicted CXXCH cytochrome family protein